MKSRVVTIAIALLAPMLASAAGLDIPAQPLAASVQQLADLTALRFTFAADVDTKQGAPELHDIGSLAGALDVLLAHTNLTYHVLDDGTIEISPIDEIQITGRYEKLSAMKKEYEALEDEFYREYNKLNTIHDYDVNCRLENMHGSFIKTRVCMAVFVEKAQAAAFSGAMDGHPGAPAFARIARNTPTFRDNMRDLVSKNPKLLELLMKRSAAAQRYEVTRKKKLEGGKIFVWD